MTPILHRWNALGGKTGSSAARHCLSVWLSGSPRDDEKARETQQHLAVRRLRIGFGYPSGVAREKKPSLVRVERIEERLQPRRLQPLDDCFGAGQRMIVGSVP